MKKRILSLVCVVSLLLFVGCKQKIKETEGKKILVNVVSLEEKQIEQSLSIPANVYSSNTALVSPELPGVITQIMVKNGDKVKKDKTVLFETDSNTIQKNLEKSKQGMSLAKLKLEESKANLEKIEAEYDNAKAEYERNQMLFEKKAISDRTFESISTKFKSAKAMVRYGKSLVSLAEESVKQAQIDLSLAQDTLNDTKIEAPIDGVVVAKMTEIGEMGAPGVPVIKIVDIKNLEIKAYIPAKYYSLVKENMTDVVVNYENKEVKRLKVSYKSPIIDSTFRTFEIRMDTTSDNDILVPGALVDVRIIFDSSEKKVIPETAVIKRGTTDVVFIAENGIAKEVAVKPVFSKDGMVVLDDYKNLMNKKIITTGNNLLEDGTKIIINQGR